MQNLLQAVWTHVHAALPVLLSVLPSLINALLEYPRTQGVARGLHVVLDMLSVLARRDSPGTLKLPLTLSAKPVNGVAPNAPKSWSPPPTMVNVLLAFVML